MDTPRKTIRLKKVLERTDSSKSSIYRWMAAGTFPLPVRLGDQSNRWWEDEIEAWQASRPRATSLGPKPAPDSPPDAEQAAAA